VNVDLLNTQFWYPVENYPNWWSTPTDAAEQAVGPCFGASINSYPLDFKLFVKLTYPVCDWSIFDFLAAPVEDNI